MNELIRSAAEMIFRSKLTLALTGAGISVESGIPDFRSAGGLWSKYDPSEYATISAFRQNPERVWNMLREMDAVVSRARPNPAHTGMGEMEKMGFLHCIITQNVDNLHQAGGARNVIEYHGNSSSLSCPSCGRTYRAEEKRAERTPRCECKYILKPDVVFEGDLSSLRHEKEDVKEIRQGYECGVGFKSFNEAAAGKFLSEVRDRCQQRNVTAPDTSAISVDSAGSFDRTFCPPAYSAVV